MSIQYVKTGCANRAFVRKFVKPAMFGKLSWHYRAGHFAAWWLWLRHGVDGRRHDDPSRRICKQQYCDYQ
jgi:hypothetical protein